MKEKIRITMLVRKTLMMLDSRTPPNDLLLATFRSDLSEAVKLISEEIDRRDGAEEETW